MAVSLYPEVFGSASAYELLEAAAQGRIGLDQRWLHALVDGPARSLPDLLRFAMEDRGEDRVVLEEDLISIFHHLRTPEALPFFVDLVRDDPYDTPDELVECFALFPERSSELLLELYNELGDREGSEVAFLLATLRVRDPRIAELLNRRRETGCEEADFYLELYNDQSPASVPDHPEFDLWEMYPETAGPEFDLLSEAERLEFLSAPSAEYRAGAASSFLEEELSPAARERLLATAESDEDPGVRSLCWEALAVALERPEVRAAMMARLTDPQVPLEERYGALVGLSAEADDPDVRRMILELYEHPAARAKALEAMSRSFDRTFAAFFPPHLDDPDPDVRREAILGVGRLAIRAEVGRLRAMFKEEEFREDALFAYTLAVPAEISRGRAKALFRKVDREAGGLSPSEADLVRAAIDHRLAAHGLEPVFSGADEEPFSEADDSD